MMPRTAPFWAKCAILMLMSTGPLTAQRFQSPDEGNQSFQMAIRLERAGNFDQALTIYRELVDEFPGQNRYYFQLVRLLRQQQNHTERLAAINEHIKHQPNDLQSHLEIGDVYLLLNRPLEAMRTWENILGTFRNNPTAERFVLTRLLNNGFTEEGQSLLWSIREAKLDSSYFATEIAKLYALRLTYDLATDEYLNHLSSHPSAEQMIANELLSFPSDEKMINMLRSKIEADSSRPALKILASLEFKNRNYSEVIDLYRRLELPPNDFYVLANDLIAEHEYDLGESILLSIIENEDYELYHERAIMSTASIHLHRSQAGRRSLHLGGLFPGNSLFDRPFLRLPNDQLESLRNAMVLYDSMAVSRQNPTAFIKMAEIKYRILDDFDGAIAALETVLRDRRAQALFPEVILQLIDAWIAKGDYVVADQVRQMAPRLLREKEQLDRVELKATELIFLSGNSDSLLAHISGLMTVEGPSAEAFNDLLELSSLVNQIAKEPQTYQRFVASERFLRQNRRSEAIAILQAEVNDETTNPNGLIKFRLAQLLAMQGDYLAADQFAFDLGGTGQYEELGLLLAAESADYLALDPTLASERYLTFMENFQLSVYHDAVRLRYRALNQND